MYGYPTFDITFEDLEKIQSLSKKLHCAMKFTGSQLVNVSMFKKWLLIYKEQLNIKEGEIESTVEDDTPYGWSSITNYMVNHLIFIPVGEVQEWNDVYFYEEFVVLKKVTIYDFKFDDSCCTAAIDKCEAKEIIRMGVDAYNMIKRPEILEIQKRYYNEPEDEVLEEEDDLINYGDGPTQEDFDSIPQEINDGPFDSDDENMNSPLPEKKEIIVSDEVMHEEVVSLFYECNIVAKAFIQLKRSSNESKRLCPIIPHIHLTNHSRNRPFTK
uniref:DBD_Tnp_Mut domain-containing protein n=1 Tax=Strongyloides papillosus TaxID=174720 RepID=A0A0N5BCD6_STREA